MGKKPGTFLTMGNGHHIANRRRALDLLQANIPGLEVLDESTVKADGFGICHFAAYTNDLGATISTPNRDDNTFGSADRHACKNIMMFREGGRPTARLHRKTVCPSAAARSSLSSADAPSVTTAWEDVSKLARYRKVFPLAPTS